MPQIEGQEEPKSNGLLKLFQANEPDGDGESGLSVEEGDTGSADGELSLEVGTESEGEPTADDSDGEGEELEPGGRAQKRIEALVSAKNAEREAKVELQSKLTEASKVIEGLRGEVAASEGQTPDWFDDLYGGFADPLGTARFDAALCGVLDEPAFRDDPRVKQVLDRAMAELKKRGFSMTTDAKPQAKKKEEAAAETVAPAIDFVAKSLVENSVKDVCKRAGVRPELVSVLTDAVTPDLLKKSTTEKAMPAEQAIVAAISAHVKTLGWKPDFYRAPKEDAKQEARPGTGGSRAAVVTPKKAAAGKEKGDTKLELPKTAEEADAARSDKIRTLIEQLPADQRGAVA